MFCYLSHKGRFPFFPTLNAHTPNGPGSTGSNALTNHIRALPPVTWHDRIRNALRSNHFGTVVRTRSQRISSLFGEGSLCLW
jgi:hypothetical protein